MIEPIFKMIALPNFDYIEGSDEPKTNTYVNGECVFFRPDGTISEIANYACGALHGEHIIFGSDGSITVHHYFMNMRLA